ncbi:MAG: radical SAM protein [Spirochaetaceae bacterium]|nr:MAG: radical SAM protein [Spirochaetaceae bacterium]
MHTEHIRKRFLFVYPRIPETYWSYRHALRFVGKRALMPPLGLATVAAMLPAEYGCRIVDMNVETLTDNDIHAADLVLLSAMIVQRQSMQEVIARCRRLGTAIAAGGPYPTANPDEIDGVDYLILGEAEESFREFLDDYAAGLPAARYRSTSRPSLDATPIPRFDLLDMAKYDTVPIQFSRGCPYDCEFCDIIQLFGRKVRTKRPQRFIAEMEAARDTGFRGSMFIVDDNFVGNHRRAKQLLRSVVAWQRQHGFPFNLCTEASIDLAHDRELLDLMVDAGFRMVFVGLESPEETSLAAVGKRQNLRRDIVESVRAIQRSGIEVTGGFIIGFDSDPPQIFERQIRFVQELAIPTAMVGLLMALPQTRLYHRLQQEQRLRDDSNGNNLSADRMNFVPLLPEQLIRDGYRRVLRTIYSPSRYFARCRQLLELLPPRRRSDRGAARIRWRELLGATHSLLRQSFSRYGPHYLRFMIRSLLRRPDRIVHIFTMAIQGHHYMKVTDSLFPRHDVDGRM